VDQVSGIPTWSYATSTYHEPNRLSMARFWGLGSVLGRFKHLT
jgi:hypothetical protein